MRVGIVDYGAGNLHSVQRALSWLAAHGSGAFPVPAVEPLVGNRPAELSSCDAVILPGVGAFAAAMQSLQAAGWTDWLREWVGSGRPFLGICLGLQLLFSASEEGGPPDVPGLDILPGRVLRLRPGSMGGAGQAGRERERLPVPHMGWNQVHLTPAGRQCPLFAGVPDGSYFYFVHSFFVQPRDPSWDCGGVAATTDYGGTFPVAVWRDSVFAVQFHPEKSGQAGLQILGNFLHLADRCQRGEAACCR
ncbi:MAG: imidazole glycerol phosphate synthase subunit HisH [Firmicutes bacterium]|nr:imidazole glycerol phosphate synthase subunit HisH [Bacillota bacterium]